MKITSLLYKNGRYERLQCILWKIFNGNGFHSKSEFVHNYVDFYRYKNKKSNHTHTISYILPHFRGILLPPIPYEDKSEMWPCEVHLEKSWQIWKHYCHIFSLQMPKSFFKKVWQFELKWIWKIQNNPKQNLSQKCWILVEIQWKFVSFVSGK